MTENNAAQPGLTKAELDAIHATMQNYAACNINVFTFIARAIESALLSKLRAEGAGDVDEQNAEAWLIEWQPGDGNTWVEADANEVRAREKAKRMGGTATPMVRAALASAPVAGEAHMPPGYRVKVVEGHGYRITPPTGGDWVAHSDTPAGDLIAALLATSEASAEWVLFEHEDGRMAAAPSVEDAAFTANDPAWHRFGPVTLEGGAPQDSEAVRILFPTHLRKMWSGGEVQAWLDEHRGVTAPKPSAKGSLERYRKWQAERAGETQCSCPSGDGSLRHPCAVHGGNAGEQLLKAARRAVLALAAAAKRDAAFQVDYDALSAALSAQPGAQNDA